MVNTIGFKSLNTYKQIQSKPQIKDTSELSIDNRERINSNYLKSYFMSFKGNVFSSKQAEATLAAKLEKAKQVNLSGKTIFAPAGIGYSPKYQQIPIGLNLYLGMNVQVPMPGTMNVPEAEKIKCHRILGDKPIELEFEGRKKYFQLLQNKIKYFEPAEQKEWEIDIIHVVDSKADGEPIKSTDKEFKDTLISQFDSLYFLKPEDVEKGKKVFKIDEHADSEKALEEIRYKAYTCWNKILAKIIEKQDKKPDILMMHDYQNSLYPVFLKADNPELFKSCSKVYMVHNKDDALTKDETEFTAITGLNPVLQANTCSGSTSWAGIGMDTANVILVDSNYSKILAEMYEENYSNNHPVVRNLTDVSKCGTYSSVHHAISSFNPRKAKSERDPVIAGAEFVPLSIPKEIDEKSRISGEDFAIVKNLIKEYKSKNKNALYSMIEKLPYNEEFSNSGGKVYGSLTHLKDSKIFTYLDRLDPLKANQLVIDEMPAILEKHPNAQLIISSNPRINTSTEELEKFEERLISLTNKYPGQVVYIAGQPNRQVLFGGSDFGLKPSLIESFGIIPLEMMRSAIIPIYYNDHGMKSVIDTSRGIPITPIDHDSLNSYKKYLEHPSETETKGSLEVAEAKEKAGAIFRKSINEALSLSQDEKLDMEANAFIYADKKHSWKNLILEKYQLPLQYAMLSNLQ